MAKVSIVIPNYNGCAYLEKCLSSLEKQTFLDQEVIVVDNGSKDESISFMKEHFPEVKIKKLDKNYGFCKAVNIGIKASKAPYVLLLNNDTIAHERMVEALVEELEENEDVFSAQAQMLKIEDSNLIDDAGNFYCALGWAFARGKGMPKEQYSKKGEIFACCAGAALYRREVFEEIGYFDEAHFAYLEDIDIGYRAKVYGYKNVYVSEAVVDHVGSATTGSRYNSFKVAHAARNSLYLIRKNMPAAQIMLNLPFLLAGYGIKTAFFVKKGFGKEYLTGLCKGLFTPLKLGKTAYQKENRTYYLRVQMELWENIWRRIANK